jgi:hypothetical protein
VLVLLVNFSVTQLLSLVCKVLDGVQTPKKCAETLDPICSDLTCSRLTPLYSPLCTSLFHCSNLHWCQATESKGESTSFIYAFVEGVSYSGGRAVIKYPLHHARFDIILRKRVADRVPQGAERLDNLPRAFLKLAQRQMELITPINTYDLRKVQVKVDGESILVDA